VDEGVVGAAVDTFRADIRGRGGHGAYPHETLDPIWLASQVLNALYAIPSRRISPLQPSVVTVGVVRGGTVDNVIPASVRLEGTLRSFDSGVREQLVQDVERAFQIVRAFGGDYDLRIERGYPPLVNDPAAAGWLRTVAGDLLGEASVASGNVSMGAEDFAFMAQRAPGAMFGLGVKAPGAEPRYLHTPTFDLDEDALPTGAAILAETALRYVRGELRRQP
jgi:amidohydrolase